MPNNEHDIVSGPHPDLENLKTSQPKDVVSGPHPDQPEEENAINANDIVSGPHPD